MPFKNKFLRRIFGRRVRQQYHEESKFTNLWNTRKKSAHTTEIVQLVVKDVNAHIVSGELEAEEIIRDGLNFTLESADPSRDLRNREILLELINLLALHAVDNRSLVRDILTRVFSISRCVDRAVFLFDYADSIVSPLVLDDVVVKKQEYMLAQTAGWKVSGTEIWGTEASTFYLEQPFRRASSNANSTIMAEALFRQQDAEFVLRLLRAGLTPSCLYLWPICILIDLRYAMSGGYTVPSDDEMLESKEAKILRYFCRARHYLHLHVVRTEERSDTLANLPMDISYDDILLIPPRATCIVPENRYQEASPLVHQCRLAIRRALLEADHLPDGITKLPLPRLLHQYIDLQID